MQALRLKPNATFAPHAPVFPQRIGQQRPHPHPQRQPQSHPQPSPPTAAAAVPASVALAESVAVAVAVADADSTTAAVAVADPVADAVAGAVPVLTAIVRPSPRKMTRHGTPSRRLSTTATANDRLRRVRSAEHGCASSKSYPRYHVTPHDPDDTVLAAFDLFDDYDGGDAQARAHAESNLVRG